MNNLLELQNNINYFFKDEKLLEQALTHLSYANDNNVPSYERLEFLGDALSLVKAPTSKLKCL